MQTLAAARERIRELTLTWWALTTFASAFEGGLLDTLDTPHTAQDIGARTATPVELVEAMMGVVVALGFVRREGGGFVAAPGLAQLLSGPARADVRADLTSTILQGAEFYKSAMRRALTRGWDFTDPAILEAQGSGSGSIAEAMVEKVMPTLEGMSERMTAPGFSFLDVGAGTGTVSIEMARRLPHARVVGLEPAPAPLALAKKNIAHAGLSERITLRQERVEDMIDEAVYDFIWLPSVFFSSDVLAKGLKKALRALRPGAWIMLPSLSVDGDDLRPTVSRLRNVMWGGDVLRHEDLVGLLATAGFAPTLAVDVPGPGNMHMGILFGRRPA
jgi:predicted O-methyltransferase YrrM